MFTWLGPIEWMDALSFLFLYFFFTAQKTVSTSIYATLHSLCGSTSDGACYIWLPICERHLLCRDSRCLVVVWRQRGKRVHSDKQTMMKHVDKHTVRRLPRAYKPGEFRRQQTTDKFKRVRQLTNPGTSLPPLEVVYPLPYLAHALNRFRIWSVNGGIHDEQI